MSKHFFSSVLIFWSRQKLTPEERDEKFFRSIFPSFDIGLFIRPLEMTKDLRRNTSEHREVPAHLIFMRKPREARQVHSAKGDTELGQCMRRNAYELTEQSRGLTIHVISTPALWPYLTLKRHLNPISGEQSNPFPPSQVTVTMLNGSLQVMV